MNRLFKKGIVTTVIGVVCIMSALYMYLNTSYTEVAAAAVAAIGFVFLRSKDSLIGFGR